MRLKLMDPVYDTRKPGVLARFQSEYVNKGERWAVIRVPGAKRPINLPMRLIVPVRARKPYGPRKLNRSTQASRVYKRLEELKGWDVAECRRRAKAVGLRIEQMLQALTE